MSVIPERLTEKPLIRVCPPECDVHSECGAAGKRPVKRNSAVEPLSAIGEWVESGGNAGMWLGGSSLVVVDVDGREAARAAWELLPETFDVETGSGWYHRYYHCEQWTETVRFDGGEVIGGNQMVVIPPSIHPGGGQYEVHREFPITKVSEGELSRFIEEVGERRESERKESETVGERDGVGDSREALDELDELIRHDEKRREVREVLRDRTAEHDRRCWLAGFLHGAVGLSSREIVGLIDEYNRWENYDRSITRDQVRSVVDSSGGGRV